MGSNPELRERITSALAQLRTVECETLGGLKVAVGMECVSNSQFRKALWSLHYNPGPVRVFHPWDGRSSRGPYIATYRTV